ncbi:succinyl-diaminopimelate desuccinylase [Haematospirillum jordaniae]|uniref:succinyl-diaminopimelate desuccinylase n=1 Tax=Haematospirillum jordaniae TaxID=1549855 RepID=UPI002AC37225|nr:succinyl-diaminopimelate desuccinylase [Haematospirillum jordaniae]
MTDPDLAPQIINSIQDLRDPLPLAQALLRCPSVTPNDAGALHTLQQVLERIGFTCTRLVFSEPGTPDVANLYARLGTRGPNFCFAGHTDVVPAPPSSGWSHAPFGGEVVDGVLYGRGAADMKGAIAAFVAAVARLLEQGHPAGSISLLITGDEEGPAINGTRKLLDWVSRHDTAPDMCLVGEPTNPDALGDMIKIGRRGSLSGILTVHGTQGHVAYPHRADNPLPRMLALLQALTATPLDEGTADFQPSNLELTSIDTGNTADNVIPGQVRVVFNVRFNTCYTAHSLEAEIRSRLAKVCPDPARYSLETVCSGEPFLTPQGELSALLMEAISTLTGRTPELSTSGGTSDARFIRHLCPVAEFGLVGRSMHKVDEHCRVDDLETLTQIYHRVLSRFFQIRCQAAGTP